jgi:hypothetical protein
VFVTFRIIVIPFSIFLNSSIAFPIAVYLAIALNLLFVEWRRKKNMKPTLGEKTTPADLFI